MTRSAVALRLFALAMAGGSFLPGAVHAAPAEQTDAAPALAVGAARLNIAPLRLELDGAKPAATLMLTNTSDRVVPVQTRLFAWSQQNGEDRFAPSASLTISPAIIAIQPGATQIVRLVRTGPPTPGEKPFRVTVDQLPDPTLAQGGQAEARLRFSVPVFFDRDKAAPAQLAWRVTANGLEVTNSGGSTARILDVAAQTADGRKVDLKRNALRYVLGGSTIAWPIANGCSLGTVKVLASIDGQTVNAQAVPSCG